MGSWDGDGVKDSKSEADGSTLGRGQGGGRVRSTMNFAEKSVLAKVGAGRPVW
jgi:hypothetical protein